MSDKSTTVPRLTLNFQDNNNCPATSASSRSAAHTSVFSDTWNKLEMIQAEQYLLSLFGINQNEHQTTRSSSHKPAPTTETTPSQSHLRYITKVNKDYKPIAYGDRDLLTKYLRTKILINNSSRKLSDRDVEVLALGLGFVLHSDFAPGCPMEELTSANNRWVLGINRFINFKRNLKKRIAEKGLASTNHLRGVLESSGRLERDRDDWDPFDRTDNEWTNQSQFQELNKNLKLATSGGVLPNASTNKRRPLYDSGEGSEEGE